MGASSRDFAGVIRDDNIPAPPPRAKKMKPMRVRKEKSNCAATHGMMMIFRRDASRRAQHASKNARARDEF